MLSKNENKVMTALCTVCKDKDSTLISPMDLVNIVGDKGFTQTTLEQVMKDLNADGYFDLVYSDRRGEKVYCVTLLEKGKGYTRGVRVFKRNLLFRLGLTVALAIVSFLIGLILKAIF